ncbi:MAG: hypothetical protein L0F83_00835 [Lactococcus raffinolactis]|nr:hypothetical protein [Lactococcus raffinolactis]
MFRPSTWHDFFNKLSAK